VFGVDDAGRMLRSGVRVLVINNHCLNDPTAGVTQSLRTIVQWLSDAGHACEVVTTARVETPGAFDVPSFLQGLGVEPRIAAGRGTPGARPVARYQLRGVAVSLVMTRHHDEARPHRAEATQYVALVERRLAEFRPDLVLACNAHPMIGECLARARRQGVITVFTLRSYGYEDRRFFANVDHVFTCSRFLSDAYRRRIGLISTPIEPPIDWSTVVAPEADRAFVTFVHPAPHKGLYLFARLAVVLGASRPDIPLLIVQSGASAGALNGLAGLDFSNQPQIMAAPAVATPAEYFALTRLLLVPSVWDEPFGRVAAEAMINGIPALVSDRGALPDVIGSDAPGGAGGRVLPVPAWMTFATTAVPSEAEIAPWADAVCTLWDDHAEYQRVAARARALAQARYGEAESRARHVEYFASLVSGGPTADGARPWRDPVSGAPL
jgi:glycosyltransferase involved in cell wall biosynthesis